MNDDERLASLLRAVASDRTDLTAKKAAVSILLRLGRPAPGVLFRANYGRKGKPVPTREQLVARYTSTIVWTPGDAPPVGLRVRRPELDFCLPDGRDVPQGFSHTELFCLYRSPNQSETPRSYRGVLLGWESRVTYPSQHCHSCTCEKENDGLGFWRIATDYGDEELHPPWVLEPEDDDVRRRLLQEQGRLCSTCNGMSFVELEGNRPCPSCVLTQAQSEGV